VRNERVSGQSDILRHLEPVTPPTANTRVASQPRQRLEEADFHTLIASAQNDITRTNRPVDLPSDISLTPEQCSRLERAADAALSHDSSTALVMLDGRPLLLDVQTREVREEVRPDAKSDRIITDIDTVIVSREETAADGQPTHNLLLRRLSGAVASSTVSGLINRGERGSSRLETHDFGA